MNFIRRQTEGHPRELYTLWFYGRVAVGTKSAAERRVLVTSIPTVLKAICWQVRCVEFQT